MQSSAQQTQSVAIKTSSQCDIIGITINTKRTATKVSNAILMGGKCLVRPILGFHHI
jgi:hypothetical protein